MTKLVKREAILAKIEGTPGVDASPQPLVDAILVEDIGWSLEGLRMFERNPVRQVYGKLKPEFGGCLMQVTFNVELKGSGTAGVAPEINPLLGMCGCGVNVVASTSVTYAGRSTGFEYGTLYFYDDGSLYKMLGCQGTFGLAANTGDKAMLSFTITGHMVDPVDTALPAFSYHSAVPAPFIGASFSTGGFASIIDNLTFDIGNVIETPPNPNSADGYGRIQIMDHDYTGSFDPEATLVADDDPIADLKAGTTKAIQTGVIGSDVGNRWALSMPTCAYAELGPGERNGIRTRDIGFMCAGDDSAFSLAFT